jgi:hypothetical protein
VQIVTAVIVAYAAIVLVGAVVAFLRKVPRPPTLDQLAWILEGALVVRATVDVAAMLHGDKPTEMSTHLGYLISSVVVLPVALAASPTSVTTDALHAVAVRPSW